MAKILITGGAGFIGSHTADALISQGHSVRILDILDPQIHSDNSAFPDYVNKAVECIHGDVRCLADVIKALDQIDVVYHFAALTGVGQSMYDIRNYVDTNCTGTATLLEAIVKSGININKLILASSRAVYGEGTFLCKKHGLVYPKQRKREDLEQGRFNVHCPECNLSIIPQTTKENRPLFPTSIYAWTKQQQEELCKYAAQTFNLPIVILRYFNVYGSRQSLQNPYTGVVSIFFSRIMSGQPIYIYENGKPMRDFVHVKDVAQANLKAMTFEGQNCEIFNVGSGDQHTIGDIATNLGKACNQIPITLDQNEFRVGDIYACYADISKTQDLLNYAPQYNLELGMKEFSEWAEQQASVDLYQQTVDELKKFNLFGHVKKS